MKKFYTSIFAAVFLLSSFLSQGQVVYNSILDNSATNYTLDDFRFWGGTSIADAPPNPCINCVLSVWTSVVVPHQGQSSFPPDNSGPFTNHITLVNSLLKLQGAGTVLSVNTYLSLTSGSSVFIATDPSYNVTILVNDQVDMDASSSIQIGNGNSYVDANNAIGNTIIAGPYANFANFGNKDAGIYSILPAPVGGFAYSLTLNAFGIGTFLNNFGQYNFNCTGGAGFCAQGIVNGPATTGPDATFGPIFAGSSTLPVQVVKFLANAEDDGSVLVNWATSQEQNSSYYDVERSGDQATWTKIGSVRAKGYSSTTSNYSFSDKLPLDGNGYYRLKMVDLDGQFEYSKIISVSTGRNNQALVVYNNPFTDQIRLKVNISRAQNLTMTVSDMLGRTYINQSYHAQSGDNFVNLLPVAAGNGMYVLRIHGDSYDQTIKLEKQ